VSARTEAPLVTSGRRLPAGIVLAVAAGWVLLFAAQLSGSHLLDHDAIFADGRTGWTAIARFLIGWQVMVVAMMLPPSFGAIRKVASRGFGLGRFLAGFAAVWTVFAAAALNLDSVVHQVVNEQPWLTARPSLVAAGLLAIVGIVELTTVPHRCLAVSKEWAPTLSDLHGEGYAFANGARYGALCVGCDGALMLLMFGIGKGNVAWMAVLGGLMAMQRATWLKDGAHRWIAIAALASAAAVLLAAA